MPSLDRFAYGLPDPQDAPIMAECAECGAELYEGNEVWEWDDAILCSNDCLIEWCKSAGAYLKVLGED